jgi:toxin FitB
MNVVDSSAWLEYFADGGNAEFFAAAIEATDDLLVPSITLYEVFKRVALQRSEGEALAAVAQMQRGKVIELSGTLALDSTRTSLELKLPLSDSVILTTARAFDATLWTQDADFEGVSGVMYASKASD